MCAKPRFRSACAIAQSDQNLHWAHFGEPRLQRFFMRTKKILICLCGCKGWFESSLGAYDIAAQSWQVSWSWSGNITTFYVMYFWSAQWDKESSGHILDLVVSQSDSLIWTVVINSHTKWQTVQIQISWLLNWVYIVRNGRAYPGSAGQGLMWSTYINK